MMTSYRNATRQIDRDRRRQEEARSARDQALRPVRIIDALISRLEDLHLEGRKRVPDNFDPTLAQLNEALPEDLRRALKSRVTISHLMDTLYEIQDLLFARLVCREEPDENGTDAGSATELERAS